MVAYPHFVNNAVIHIFEKDFFMQKDEIYVEPDHLLVSTRKYFRIFSEQKLK